MLELKTNTFNQYHNAYLEPVTSAALISAGANLFGGWLNSSGQKKANQTNLQIARETNAANAALAREQNQWNLDMWNRQNEYNDPSAQIARVRAAGLNPAFHGIDGNGNATTLPTSANMANQQIGAPMQNEMAGLGQGIADAGISAVNSALQVKQTQIAEKKADAEIKNLNENTKTQEELQAVYKSEANLNDKLAEEASKRTLQMQTQIDESVLRQNILKLDEQDKQKRLAQLDDMLRHDKEMRDMAESMQKLLLKHQSLQNTYQFLLNQGQKFANMIASDDADVSRYVLEYRKDAEKMGFKLESKITRGDLSLFDKRFSIAATALDIEEAIQNHTKHNLGKQFALDDTILENLQDKENLAYLLTSIDVGQRVLNLGESVSRIGSNTTNMFTDYQRGKSFQFDTFLKKDNYYEKKRLSRIGLISGSYHFGFTSDTYANPNFR